MDKSGRKKTTVRMTAAEVDVDTILEGYMQMQHAHWDVDQAVKRIVDRTFDKYERQQDSSRRQRAVA